MDSPAALPIRSSSGRPRGTFGDYLRLGRLDHSTKHFFIVPGFALAYLLRGAHTSSLFTDTLLGLVAAICIASANYVINEYLDRDFDRYHPTKSQRRAVQCELRGAIVWLEWLFFAGLGFSLALTVSSTLFVVMCVFALQGLVYNVPPVRAKDKTYLDVISESVNNALRLIIGWVIVDPFTLPPSSVILSCWFGGAFLMGAKRYSEYRDVTASHGRELLVRYRASFAGYTEISLLTSCFVYGLLSTFFLAIFLIKYRVEYLLLMPVVVFLFGYYLALSAQPNSAAQHPETLIHDKKLLLIVFLFVILFLVTTFVDIPVLSMFAEQRYIMLQ
jgi:4-hydroxybenzoate polyprenyltransferase